MESSPSDEPDIERPLATQQNGDYADRIEDTFGQTNGDSDQKIDAYSDFSSSDYDENIPEDLSDSDSCLGMEVTYIFTCVLCSLDQFSWSMICDFPKIVLLSTVMEICIV